MQSNDDSKLQSIKDCHKERIGQNGKRLYNQSQILYINTQVFGPKFVLEYNDPTSTWPIPKSSLCAMFGETKIMGIFWGLSVSGWIGPIPTTELPVVWICFIILSHICI